MRTIIFFILTLCIAHGQQDSSLITRITSTHLVVGEAAYFDLIYRDKNPRQAPPETIEVGEGLSVRQRGFASHNINGDRYFIYQYSVIAEQEGTYSIPSLTLQHDGNEVQSQPAEITVLPADQLEQIRYKHGDDEFSCYSYLHLKKTELYPGESIQAEYKIYMPAKINPIDLGLPKPEVVENCTAWRFEPPRRSSSLTAARLNNQRYAVASYTTVISALNPGPAKFGPLDTIITIAPTTVRSNFGFTRRETKEMQVVTNAKEFTVLPFPTTPPNSFNGAVGDFTLEATLPTDTEISTSDSITVSLNISGSGNLPMIEAPELEDSATWKVVDVSRVQQGDERKSLIGNAEFTYILQPKRGATEYPRFTFTHFNPDTKEFQSDTTATFPITVKAATQSAATAILPNAEIPQENMQDILGPLASIDLSASTKNIFATLPIWWWHAIPTAILLGMLATVAKRKFANRKQDPNKQLKLKAYKSLEQTENADFLPSAAAFAQKWLPEEEFTESLCTQRDERCYQPTEDHSISKEERLSILNSLKKLTFLISFCFLLSSVTSEADQDNFELWKSGNTQEALDGYKAKAEQHPESADLLYNIGACYYRLGDPGNAALYFQRALAISGKHPEAQKNLEFTQKQQGAILPEELTEVEAWITKLSKPLYIQIAFASAWMLLLGVLALSLFKPKGGYFIVSVLSIIIAPCIAVISIAGWLKYPEQMFNDSNTMGMVTRYAPVQTEPIIVSGQNLSTKTLINATPSSPCNIIAVRDEWSYIELANKTRGWIKSDAIDFVEQ